MKLWYKKKIRLQDIFLSKKQWAKVAHQEVLEGKLVAVLIDTSNEESKVEL